MCLLELDGTKLFNSEVTALSSFELIQALMDSNFRYFYDIDDFPHSASKVVHSSGQNQSCPTYSTRTSTGNHPISIHALDNFGSFVGNLHCVRFKFELLCKAIDEVLWTDRVDQKGSTTKTQFVQKGFVSFTQLEDVNMKDIGEVDEHDLIRVLSTTCNVQADCCDIPCSATLNEVGTDGEFEYLEAGIGNSLSDVKSGGELVDVSLAVGFGDFSAFHAASFEAWAETPAMGLIGTDISSLDYCSTGRTFPKGDLGDYVRVAKDGTAASADLLVIIVDDFGLFTVGVRTYGGLGLSCGLWWLGASTRGRIPDTGQTLDRLASCRRRYGLWWSHDGGEVELRAIEANLIEDLISHDDMKYQKQSEYCFDFFEVSSKDGG